MKTNKYVLGIDTSNYTTSVAVIDENGEIVYDIRKILEVKQGERGLQQSHALFKHIEILPGLLSEAMQGKHGNQDKQENQGKQDKQNKNDFFCAVAVSTRPRPVEGSYMPVFKAGESFARVIATTLNIPLFEFSHQEGHIEAVKAYSSFKDKKSFLCFQLSGGTCELLKVDGDSIEIIGGSKDISFGQLLDRLGVLLGIGFPCGVELDKIACEFAAQENKLKLSPIPVDGLFINLSGIETQTAKIIENIKKQGDFNLGNKLIKEMFDKIGNALITLMKNAVIQTGYKDFLFTGGVSSSKYLYSMLKAHFDDANKDDSDIDNLNINIEFGKQELASDNAVGIALLGLNKTSARTQ